MWESKAEITEIFSSIQGEGVFLGARQIFIRFKDCNMNCVYCDERKGLKAKQYSPLDLISEVRYLELSAGPHHSVSLTGGEPLLYARFLVAFLKLLRKERIKAYLETNGTLPEELIRIIDLVDIVAMDFKLPSSTGERPFWNEHLEFLKIAAKKKVFVKAVVTPDTERGDVEKSVTLLKKVGTKIPFILQPATPVRAEDKHVDRNRLFKFLEIGTNKKLENIRIIPQIHKILNVK